MPARRRRDWQPVCPTCGSDEVDFAPFTEGKEWECLNCGMKFNDEMQEL